ncbi:MAG TPA: LemA family protein [Caulobacteraceae bacterium]|nr:LemA family protein [Caulobacteraceae bacterium]
MSLAKSRRLPLWLALAIPLVLGGCGVNTIPTKQEAAKAAWAEVQNQYQRRSDLIPNLVQTVQGYAQQERGVLVDVTNARAKATSVQVDASTITNPAAFKQYEQAQNNLSGVLGRLMVVNERYPELKSNENFLALQSQLEGTENRIAIARRDYNSAVQSYNTEIHTFPGVLWVDALYHDAKDMSLFSASEQAQSAPQVNFNIPPPGGGAPAVAPGSAPPK